MDQLVPVSDVCHPSHQSSPSNRVVRSNAIDGLCCVPCPNWSAPAPRASRTLCLPMRTMRAETGGLQLRTVDQIPGQEFWPQTCARPTTILQTLPSNFRMAVILSTLTLAKISGGICPRANRVATSPKNVEQSPLSKRIFRCSVVIPDGPAAAPRRAVLKILQQEIDVQIHGDCWVHVQQILINTSTGNAWPLGFVCQGFPRFLAAKSHCFLLQSPTGM